MLHCTSASKKKRKATLGYDHVNATAPNMTFRLQVLLVVNVRHRNCVHGELAMETGSRGAESVCESTVLTATNLLAI